MCDNKEFVIADINKLNDLKKPDGLTNLREELDKTQEGKLEFDNRAKKVVTSINRLLLTIAHLVGRLNLEKSIEDSYFAKINGEFSPIFTHIPEEREGFASFLKIDPDMRYYRDVYSQMISDFDKDLAKFIEWKKKYEEELKKKYGVLKDG